MSHENDPVFGSSGDAGRNGNGGSGPRKAALDRLDERFFGFLNTMAAAIFILMVFAIFFTVILREALNLPWVWTDDLVRFLMVWSVYLGVAVLSRHNDHITVDALYEKLPPTGKRVMDVVFGLAGIFLAGTAAKLGWGMTWTAITQHQTSASTYLPAWTGYVIIPFGFGVAALGYVLFVLGTLRGRDESAAAHNRQLME